MNSFEKVLIANRGEIALRIQATCHSQGIKTVAIYTKEDQSLSYVYGANESHPLSGQGSSGYLNQDEIISIAKKSGSDAIHPGYGFLSENASFAQKVVDANLIWIGPTPENIKLLGDKARAQKIMATAGVPIIPGKTFDYSREKTDITQIEKTALTIGLPVIIKCAHGGGGKAMRLVKTIDKLESAWNTVLSESEKFFNSKSIIIEKYIYEARHIEIQIAGDGKNQIHLYERECSIQRRQQKIIEESPCSFISDQIKEKLYRAALDAAKAVNYTNIGTVEFLVTQQAFYFLEINTRLQVEHSVTELTTQIDLVWLQLYIAQHNELPFEQEEIKHNGHSIECRIYSESPKQNFAPSTGKITNLILPNKPFLRIDHDLEEGTEITPFFDPMIAKMTTFALNRKIAIKQILHALSKTNISGIETNILFLQSILETKEFVNGDVHTQLLQQNRFLGKLFSSEKLFSLKSKSLPLLSKEEIKQITNLISKDISTNKKQTESKNRWNQSRWK